MMFDKSPKQETNSIHTLTLNWVKSIVKKYIYLLDYVY